MKTTIKMACECGYVAERPVRNRALVRVVMTVMDLRFHTHDCTREKVCA